LVTEAVGLTTIDEPNIPLDHVTVPEHPEAVKVTEPPAQTVVDEVATKGGATELTIIWTLFEFGLKHVPT
jgi:hypothetical protein